MNTHNEREMIEKLIDAVEISAKNAEWDDFDNAIHALKALQSSEPVAEVVEDRLADWSKPFAKVNWIKTDFDIGTKFFTHPPASVPLEKYNKLLDALKELLVEAKQNRMNAIGMNKTFSAVAEAKAQQAIAEAEGK